MVEEKYSEQIASIEAYVEEQFVGKEDLLQQLNDAKAFVLEQALCLKAVSEATFLYCYTC
jgi:hypothetical protein